MFRKILLLMTLIVLLLSGCSSNKTNTSVSETGVRILQDTPEQAYLTYFELFNSKDRLAAYDLISPENKKVASKKDFQEWLKTVPYKSEKVIYTVSSREGSLAVVGVVKVIDVNDTTAGLYSIFALVSDGDKWYVEMDTEGLGKKKGKEINKLSLEVHKKIKKALASGQVNIENKFKTQVQGQVDAFEKSIEQDNKSKSENKSKSGNNQKTEENLKSE